MITVTKNQTDPLIINIITASVQCSQQKCRYHKVCVFERFFPLYYFCLLNVKPHGINLLQAQLYKLSAQLKMTAYCLSLPDNKRSVK